MGEKESIVTNRRKTVGLMKGERRDATKQTGRQEMKIKRDDRTEKKKVQETENYRRREQPEQNETGELNTALVWVITIQYRPMLQGELMADEP